MIKFLVEDKFHITDRGYVATGTLHEGQNLEPGATAMAKGRRQVRVLGVERMGAQRYLDEKVGILTEYSANEIEIGDTWVFPFCSGSSAV